MTKVIPVGLVSAFLIVALLLILAIISMGLVKLLLIALAALILLVVFIRCIRIVPKNFRLAVFRRKNLVGLYGPGIVVVDLFDRVLPIEMISGENSIAIPLGLPKGSECKIILTVNCLRPLHDSRTLSWILRVFIEARNKALTRVSVERIEDLGKTIESFLIPSIQKIGCRLVNLRVETK